MNFVLVVNIPDVLSHSLYYKLDVPSRKEAKVITGDLIYDLVFVDYYEALKDPYNLDSKEDEEIEEMFSDMIHTNLIEYNPEIHKNIVFDDEYTY